MPHTVSLALCESPIGMVSYQLIEITCEKCLKMMEEKP